MLSKTKSRVLRLFAAFLVGGLSLMLTGPAAAGGPPGYDISHSICPQRGWQSCFLSLVGTRLPGSISKVASGVAAKTDLNFYFICAVVDPHAAH
ncbi:MAG: hypothetical protein P8X95_16980 [Anaerolineales bacterium]